MDVVTVRTVIELIVILAFIGIAAWAYTRKDRFVEAAELPFRDGEGARRG